VTFHEQQECGYDFPSLLLANPLRHTLPKVVMGNHTHMSAVHGKSFHNDLTKRSITFNYHQFEEFLTTVQ
jgi:hypothetical protein